MLKLIPRPSIQEMCLLDQNRRSHDLELAYPDNHFTTWSFEILFRLEAETCGRGPEHLLTRPSALLDTSVLP